MNTFFFAQAEAVAGLGIIAFLGFIVLAVVILVALVTLISINGHVKYANELSKHNAAVLKRILDTVESRAPNRAPAHQPQQKGQ